MNHSQELQWIDYLMMIIYFGFVLGIGFMLKRFMRTSSEFLTAGRSIPAWVAGLAFLSANLGAQEVIGMAASGAKYGIATSHFYWLGVIPAMVFLGIFMMPFYYGSKAHSVPDYLLLRFDKKTRSLNAITFAVMTIMSSGISMYAMALLIQTLHIFDTPFQMLGLPSTWVFHVSIIVSALIVLGYTFLGGLTSAIYNEVLQFFLIVAGFAPLVFLGLKNVGGWSGLKAKLPPAFVHTCSGMGSPHNNPLGVEWFSLVMGLGFVLSFGYWCTDFLVVQRAMAADSMSAARRTPLIAALPKMLFVPVPGDLPGLNCVSAYSTSPGPFLQLRGEFRHQKRGGCSCPRVTDCPASECRDRSGGAGQRRQSSAGLQHGYSPYASALFPERHARTGADGAAGQLYVRDGR
jgi:SSS family solute:Na+ symporter